MLDQEKTADRIYLNYQGNYVFGLIISADFFYGNIWEYFCEIIKNGIKLGVVLKRLGDDEPLNFYATLINTSNRCKGVVYGPKV